MTSILKVTLGHTHGNTHGHIWAIQAEEQRREKERAPVKKRREKKENPTRKEQV